MGYGYPWISQVDKPSIRPQGVIWAPPCSPPSNCFVRRWFPSDSHSLHPSWLSPSCLICPAIGSIRIEGTRLLWGVVSKRETRKAGSLLFCLSVDAGISACGLLTRRWLKPLFGWKLELRWFRLLRGPPRMLSHAFFDFSPKRSPVKDPNVILKRTAIKARQDFSLPK